MLPIIVNNNNFAKGAPGEPTLLSFDDARTLFHEFGHGLHGLLSNVTYERVSGTNVLRDFVELPSQLFEHWLEEPEVLKRHARHYQTGEPIPDALIEQAARRAPLQPGLRDGALHGVGAGRHGGARAHRRASRRRRRLRARRARARSALPAGVGMNHRLTHFQHLFSGSGYAAGYYVYLWAEVLDADGFEAFVEAGNPFDPAVARRLRAVHLFVGQLDRAGRGVPRVPRPRGRRPSRCCEQRGLLEPVAARSAAEPAGGAGGRAPRPRRAVSGSSRCSAAMKTAKSIGLVQ